MKRIPEAYGFCREGAYIYIKSSSNLCRGLQGGPNQLSTALEVNPDSRNRRLKSKYLKSHKEEKSKPFLILEEQFEKLKASWQ